MALQASPLSPSLNQAELQSEIERLFSEVERMLDNASASEQPTPLPLNRWAYPPLEAEIEMEDIIC